MSLQNQPNARMLRSTQFAIVRNSGIRAKTNLNRANMVPENKKDVEFRFWFNRAKMVPESL